MHQVILFLRQQILISEGLKMVHETEFAGWQMCSTMQSTMAHALLSVGFEVAFKYQWDALTDTIAFVASLCI